MILTPINRRLFLSIIREVAESTLVPMRFSNDVGAMLNADDVAPFNVAEECERNPKLKELLGTNTAVFGESSNFPVIVKYGDVEQMFVASPEMLAQASYPCNAKIYKNVFLKRTKQCFGVSFKHTSTYVSMPPDGEDIRKYLCAGDQWTLKKLARDLCAIIGDEPKVPIFDRLKHALQSTDNDRLWVSLDDWAGPKHLGRCLISDTNIVPSIWEPT